MTLSSYPSTILGSQRNDNLWIIFPFLFGLLYFFSFILLQNTGLFSDLTLSLIYLLIFAIVFDAHHFFATYHRVVLDQHYFQQNKRWLTITFILLISAAFLTQWLLMGDYADYESYLFFQFFRRFVLILGFYHLIKQNWGFMALYNRFEDEKPSKINWNLIALISGSFIPLLYSSLKQPLWFPDSESLLFTPDFAQQDFVIHYWHQLAKACATFAVLFAAAFALLRQHAFAKPFISIAAYCLASCLMILLVLHYGYQLILSILLVLSITIFVISFAVSMVKQKQQKRFNIRKWLVFAGTLTLYAVAFLYPLEGAKYIVVATITIPHNIQYLAFVPIFSQKQYRKSKFNHGLAKKLSEKLVFFFIAGLVFASLFELGRSGTQEYLPNSLFVYKNFIAVFFACMALHHYYLDAIIWKFSKNKSLSQSL